MSASTTRIAEGEHSHQMRPADTVELARLAEAVNRMAEDLIRQQQLVRNGT